MKKVISVCLYGNQQIYMDFALELLERSKEYYPDWTLRYYIDQPTVPSDVVEKLHTGGAETIMKSAIYGDNEGMMWRFLVACDPQVDIYIIRDIDTFLGRRDRHAVDEWLASGQDFHIIRDHPEHLIIPGGLWGGRKKITGLNSMIENFIEARGKKQGISVGADQAFLARYLYRRIRHNVCIHSSYVRYPGEITLPSPPLSLTEKEVIIGAHPNRHGGFYTNIQHQEKADYLKAHAEKPDSKQQLDITQRHIPFSVVFQWLRRIVLGLLLPIDYVCIRCRFYPFFAGYRKRKTQTKRITFHS